MRTFGFKQCTGLVLLDVFSKQSLVLWNFRQGTCADPKHHHVVQQWSWSGQNGGRTWTTPGDPADHGLTFWNMLKQINCGSSIGLPPKQMTKWNNDINDIHTCFTHPLDKIHLSSIFGGYHGLSFGTFRGYTIKAPHRSWRNNFSLNRVQLQARWVVISCMVGQFLLEFCQPFSVTRLFRSN